MHNAEISETAGRPRVLWTSLIGVRIQPKPPIQPPCGSHEGTDTFRTHPLQDAVLHLTLELLLSKQELCIPDIPLMSIRRGVQRGDGL